MGQWEHGIRPTNREIHPKVAHGNNEEHESPEVRVGESLRWFLLKQIESTAK